MKLGPSVKADQTFGTSHSEKGPTDLGCKGYLGSLYRNLPPEQLDELRNNINFYNELTNGPRVQRTDTVTAVASAKVFVNNNFDTSQIVAGLSGMQASYLQSGQLIANWLSEMTAVLAAPRFTKRNTQRTIAWRGNDN